MDVKTLDITRVHNGWIVSPSSSGMNRFTPHEDIRVAVDVECLMDLVREWALAEKPAINQVA